MVLYWTKKKLIKDGYTHYGSLWGIPCYIKDLESEAPTITAAYWIPDWVLTVADSIVFFMESIIYRYDPYYEPCFKIRIKGEIK
ncbi:hypothetical protein [Gallibacterium anatis]|uniref:Uncharacterized protein n=2 Tax=Gallibacterium anatis TaxID=750 RepID=A0A0A2XLL2_9PAST|nr:hypothetical protein [Gallibacterium anatis]KGQ33191.1 hypothetical protein JP32_03005 [Gallibacterium anatis]KGQ57787.1 hypothetical protein IE01_03760 [Gallibacterium anatis DSM 16844 = F 149]WKS98320.1 hypothetical protein NYR19_06015 [Gallibacterium anatis]STO37588.1 Uncharacterised protein [Gallibacterium anatis]